MNENEKLRVTQRVLEDALKVVDHKLDREQREQKREENPAKIIWTVLRFVLHIVLVLAAALFAFDLLKNKKEKIEEAADLERKDLIRKLSAVKGRI
ncbi:hypothetical protein [Ileibacterium valens]|uniref:hypothetical protein n=1 Tax=Ileibacterium valens TaxID=1862668 RepID=UPI0023536FD3|nr:hypothetical protein [Ileibacterium valens]